jgi:hypothetical protein
MKRSVLIGLFLSLIITAAEAQQDQLWKLRRYEVSVGIGPSFFFGDVGGYSKSQNILGIRDISSKQIRFNLNTNLKYRITNNFNARLSLTYGLFHATDIRGSNEMRGFTATMSVFEPSVIAEYYFIKNRNESSYIFTKGKEAGFARLMKSLDFYALTGLGGLFYTIKGNDELVSTGLDSGGITTVIPLGVGTTLIYSPDFNFGVELSGRYSFSDNLDGYTSQYSSSNDVYYFLNFTITYKLRTGPRGLPSFRRN